MQLDMEKIITSQLKTNALKSLFWDRNFLGNSEFSFCCSDYTINTLLNDKQSVLAFIETLEQSVYKDEFARHMSEIIIKTLQDINQFLFFDEAGKKAVANVYLEFMDNIKALCMRDKIDADIITETFLRHYLNIRNSLISTHGTKVFREYTDSAIVSRKVCSEYTPEFQLEILNIDVKSLKEPVLDLGCGRSGSLVKYLLDHGINAYGTDRSAEEHPNLFRSDWFSFKLEPEHWGTVISHMAFSNHFRHSNEYGQQQAHRNKYFKILYSLKKGGEFIYAPGLRHIEDEIEQEGKWAVIKTHVADSESLYSTRIRKL